MRESETPHKASDHESGGLRESLLLYSNNFNDKKPRDSRNPLDSWSEICAILLIRGQTHLLSIPMPCLKGRGGRGGIV
jgi:hypothetical protein